MRCANTSRSSNDASPKCAKAATRPLASATLAAASSCRASAWTASSIRAARSSSSRRSRPGRRTTSRSRRRDRHRHRHRLGRALRDHRQRRDGERRHLLPAHGEEAPARAGDRAREPPAVHLPGGLRAARTCRVRMRSFRTATTSAASSTTRPTMSAAGIAQIAVRDGLVHRGRRLRARDVRRNHHRAQSGHDLPRRPAAGESGDRRRS